MDSRPEPKLKVSLPPALYAEGTSWRKRPVGWSDRTALPSLTRTAAHDGWDARLSFPTPELTLPTGAFPRLVLTTARPAAPDLSTPSAMRPTQRLDVLIPIRDNDGHPFQTEDFDAFEELLITLAGGFTRRGAVSGAWRSPSGQVLHDEACAYAVTVPADTAESISLSLSRFICDRFRQEAAWVESTPTFLAVA